ncbi:hypothetical protein CBOM_00074 [Ceraceosorus bombacis]|uniref:RmlC-like jelly roll fold n=1 Tax=Ceraceosorus bombacis TaxID=401625 RepID=A0A0P1B8Z1_9BASI|nr:hypothetical protein CBOM_00074 [Ceraceosorus bombacis]
MLSLSLWLRVILSGRGLLRVILSGRGFLRVILSGRGFLGVILRGKVKVFDYNAGQRACALSDVVT